jgi:excisionase family DNA binding protein
MNTPLQNDCLIDVIEAAKLAKVCQRTVWNWLESKSVSCIKLGRVVRFDRATFMAELRAFSTPVAKPDQPTNHKKSRRLREQRRQR